MGAAGDRANQVPQKIDYKRLRVSHHRRRQQHFRAIRLHIHIHIYIYTIIYIIYPRSLNRNTHTSALTLPYTLFYMTISMCTTTSHTIHTPIHAIQTSIFRYMMIYVRYTAYPDGNSVDVTSASRALSSSSTSSFISTLASNLASNFAFESRPLHQLKWRQTIANCLKNSLITT